MKCSISPICSTTIVKIFRTRLLSFLVCCCFFNVFLLFLFSQFVFHGMANFSPLCELVSWHVFTPALSSKGRHLPFWALLHPHLATKGSSTLPMVQVQSQDSPDKTPSSLPDSLPKMPSSAKSLLFMVFPSLPLSLTVFSVWPGHKFQSMVCHWSLICLFNKVK